VLKGGEVGRGVEVGEGEVSHAAAYPLLHQLVLQLGVPYDKTLLVDPRDLKCLGHSMEREGVNMETEAAS
jgi:hypothetical protein